MFIHPAFECVLLFFILLLARLFYLIYEVVSGRTAFASKKRTKNCRTLICIGSGGHTREMLTLISALNIKRYYPRFYLMANNDSQSCQKIVRLEKSMQTVLESRYSPAGEYHVLEIPRSRGVGQSYYSSVFTTVASILKTIPTTYKIQPDLVLCNGPGTCIPVCIAAFLLKYFFICQTRIIFIESFCRTYNFSLTGNILRYLADNFIIQWPNLEKKFSRATYLGQLM